jgi:DNA polymerase III delta prime subunit
MQSPVLSTEGLDIAYIADDAKFILIQTWLHQERVLLLRSPPGTGKTTFALAFAQYLRNNGFGATYLNASVPENTPNAMRSMDDIWQATFESELTFSEMSQTVPPNDLHYVIMDEGQTWYPYNINDPIGRKEVWGFWAAVKSYVQPALPFTNFPNAPPDSMPSVDLPPTGIRLLCLAGYGETNVGSMATPLGFQDPEDPVTKCRQPLGLAFLRLDRQSTNKLVERFIEVKASQGKKTTFDSDVYNLIYEATNGHVGAVRALLHHLVSSDRRSKKHVLDFVRHDVYQADLSAFRAFLCVSQSVIGRLSAQGLRLLINSIVYFKKGHHEFRVNELQIVELVKVGIFVKTAATGVNDRTRVAFPSILHFDLLLHNILHRPLDLHQSRDCFEHLLKELVLRMSPKVLRDTVMTNEKLDPLESHWQGEVSRSFRTISDRVLRTSVGREFNQQAYLDLYVDDGLQWGIELVRDGVQLGEHVGRFRSDGRYRDIPMQQYAVLNFTHYQPNAITLDRYDENVYHLVYIDTYTEVTVYRKGKVAECWNLIGHQGRTEF